MRSIAALGIAILVAGCASSSFVASDELAAEASDILSSSEVPAIGLAVMSCEIGELHVAGNQRTDGALLIEPDARFNIGSNAKSMLATVAARLEMQGDLSLDAPLVELWPEAAAAHPDKASITLAQLLSHTSGLPAFDTGAALSSVPQFGAEKGGDRLAAAEFFLSQPLEREPGQSLVYSNAGYVVASAVLEKTSGLSLPVLLEQSLFAPLEISASLGEPRRMGPRQPYGHFVSFGSVVPYTEDEAPIPSFLEGAGNVSLSTADYAAYVQMHLCALKGESRFLSQSMASRLHGEDGEFGLGWGRTELSGDPVSFHVGGTGDFSAYMVVSQAQNKAAVAVVNVGGAPARAALTWIIQTMTPTAEQGVED